MVTHQTSGPEVLGSNPARPTMILGRCRIIVYNCKFSGQRGRPPPEAQKFLNIIAPNFLETENCAEQPSELALVMVTVPVLVGPVFVTT